MRPYLSKVLFFFVVGLSGGLFVHRGNFVRNFVQISLTTINSRKNIPLYLPNSDLQAFDFTADVSTLSAGHRIGLFWYVPSRGGFRGGVWMS